MCGLTERPCSTAFFASSPAASITPGFDVFVHEVIAAIITSPLPISGNFGSGGLTRSGVGRLSTISTRLVGWAFPGSVIVLLNVVGAGDFAPAGRQPAA